MTDHVHFIPVGFDFDRLILPITKGEMEADRVVMITHEGNTNDNPTSEAAQLASNMGQQLSNAFDLIDVEVNERELDVETLYAYDRMYPRAHDYMLNELEDGNEVYANISSMPRTVAFAFATAADSLVTDGRVEDARKRVHTYYVPPERYLVLEMISLLRECKGALRDVEDGDLDALYEKTSSLLDRVDESGVTEGTRYTDPMYVEFPTSPSSDVKDFEEMILRFLYDEGMVESTTALAERLASSAEEEYDDSLKSRVQYNVGKLESKGYVDRVDAGNRYETSLSTMGRMWVETHQEKES